MGLKLADVNGWRTPMTPGETQRTCQDVIGAGGTPVTSHRPLFSLVEVGYRGTEADHIRQ